MGTGMGKICLSYRNTRECWLNRITLADIPAAKARNACYEFSLESQSRRPGVLPAFGELPVMPTPARASSISSILDRIAPLTRRWGASSSPPQSARVRDMLRKTQHLKLSARYSF
jgi:hypothetical protein